MKSDLTDYIDRLIYPWDGPTSGFRPKLTVDPNVGRDGALQSARVGSLRNNQDGGDRKYFHRSMGKLEKYQ
jgi:hypothetical protein